MNKKTIFTVLITVLALCFTLAACKSSAPAKTDLAPASTTASQPSTNPPPSQTDNNPPQQTDYYDDYYDDYYESSQPQTTYSQPSEDPRPSTHSSQPQHTGVQRHHDIIIDGAQTHTVTRGETLSRISRHYYHNGFYYPIIMLASRDTVTDMDEIEPGMKLVIPDLQRNLNDSIARARIKSYLGEVARLNESRNRHRDAEGFRHLANSL